MTDLGTASNIDTAGVCNPVPVPVPTPVPAPVAPVPAPVAPVPAPVAPVPAPVAPVPAPVAPVPTPVPAPVAPVPAPVAPVPTPVPAPVAPVPTPVAPVPTPVPAPVAPTPTVWYQNGYISGGVHQGHATTSAACADSLANGKSAFYLSDSLGPVNTAQDIRNSQAAGRTVNIWANSGLSVPMNGNSTFFGVNKDNNQNQAGMVIKFGSGVLETVVGSDLLASCLNTINLAGGSYTSYLDACNNGPSDAKTTYYQIASGCATGTAWTDIDMAQVLQNSSVSGFGIYYQEASECPGAGNGYAREYNPFGAVAGTGLC